MSAFREAILLPVLFLSVVLLAALRPGAFPLVALPGLFPLVLGVLLVGSLVRSGVLDPERLLGSHRTILANANGIVVLVTCYAAAVHLLAVLTPESGLPLFFVSVLLFVLLLNAWVSLPDRVHQLRSLMVVFGAAFVLKFVVFASLADPSGGRVKRVLLALFDSATFGAITQAAQPEVTGYLAFAAMALFLVALALLPARRAASFDHGLTRR